MSDKEQTLSVLTEQEQKSVELFKAYLADVVKFRTKGTSLAAARARKAASTLSKLFKPIRKQIQVDKVARIEERRAKKAASVTSL